MQEFILWVWNFLTTIALKRNCLYLFLIFLFFNTLTIFWRLIQQIKYVMYDRLRKVSKIFSSISIVFQIILFIKNIFIHEKLMNEKFLGINWNETYCVHVIPKFCCLKLLCWWGVFFLVGIVNINIYCILLYYK